MVSSSRVCALCFSIFVVACLSFLYPLSASAQVTATNWPGWRGDGNGISPEQKVPLHWNATTSIAWKTELPGEGNSSPIVWGQSIFLTASTDKGHARWVICLNVADGSIRWQTSLPVEKSAVTYPKSGYASPTPVCDGDRVYAFFDDPGLVALDMDGKLLWTRPLGPFKTPYNMAESLALVNDLVVQVCDHEGGSFITGIERTTGNIRWKTPRPNGLGYCSPIVIDHKGVKQIVVNGPAVKAYAADTGKELWSCKGMMDVASPSTVYSHGLVYATTGRNGPTLMIDPSGTGDITESGIRGRRNTGGAT